MDGLSVTADPAVVAVRGVVSPSDAVAVRRVLEPHLLDRGRVVVDLARASVGSDTVARLFPDALAGAGGWPVARLVLARPDPFTARILAAARIPLTVPVADTLDEARALLDVRPLRVARDHELPCDLVAPALARAFVGSACEDWKLDGGLHDVAATVATELVANAVEHAGTGGVLQLALDRRRLWIAVHDGRPVAQGRPRIAVPGDRGYGLLIVQGVSAAWGTTPCPGGKTVWAVLDA